MIFVNQSPSIGDEIWTSEELTDAIAGASDGETIELEAGIFELEKPIVLSANMTLRGAGMNRTIITQRSSWKPSTKSLPDPEMKRTGLDEDAYLIRLADKADGITVSDLTLLGPQMHGAIFGWQNSDLHLHHLRIQNTLWSGIRTFSMQNAKIHDCDFIDAGGRWKKGGEPGFKGGITGGAIFAIWIRDSEISHNRFTRTQLDKPDAFYGIKARQGKRCRLHHNTINVNFSIEFPFENDEDIEIDHNVCSGTISIPKHSGGKIPESGRTFHIHHNLLQSSYAIEFVRNGVEIDHNLFDFDTDSDGGNLITGFGKAGASGPAVFHNNLVKNPGRGVVWINEPYNRFVIRNNHIVSNTTATPREEGLFAFNDQSDSSTISIRNNIVECIGLSRPLVRNQRIESMEIKNNQLINVSDSDRYENEPTDELVGLEEPLNFQCGVHGEFTVAGWDAQQRPVN